MTSYVLTFDSTAWDELDEFALLACQDYNFGNASDWFGCFRGGFYGMRSRLRAIQQHYFKVHAWLPVPRILADAEYHLATALFHMDSAVECMTFALNALGNSVAPGAFRDVTDDKALRRILPVDILGKVPDTSEDVRIVFYELELDICAGEIFRDRKPMEIYLDKPLGNVLQIAMPRAPRLYAPGGTMRVMTRCRKP